MAQRPEEAFELLGIPASSDLDRVAEAYRRLARATHPDVSADPDAAARFATLASAYRRASAAVRSETTAAPAAGTVSSSMQTHLLGEVPASVRTGPGRRPPIVAGPVVVRRFGDAAWKGVRGDGGPGR